MPKRAMISTGFAIVACALTWAGCGNPMRARIDAESRKVAEAKDRFNKIRNEVDEDVRKEPELFRTANVTAAWRDRFQTDQEKLNDASTDLERLNHRDKAQLFDDVVRFREAAIADAIAIQTDANRWLDLKRNTPQHIAHMQQNYDKVRSGDYSRATTVLQRAEQDWPAKKNDIDARLASLKSAPTNAESAWRDAQAAKDKPDYTALMTAERTLDTLAAEPDQDLKLAGQLYDSWDKVLVALEAPRAGDGVCREKVKLIRTHLSDVPNNKSQTTSDEKWEEIPEVTYASLKDDIGMDIEHKPVGAYDTEIQRVPQPPGFAYMAPPGERNQYGYWDHREGGSVWTWLPEYLILRELLWNHRTYVPIPSYEYEGYRTARRTGTTYYGRDEIDAAPKYGTHGTFTTGRYADSRYKQTGGTYRDSQFKNNGNGFRNSPYASGQSSPSSSEQGHQFGRTPAPAPSSRGQGFGSGAGRRYGGGASRSAPSGRRFGRR